jgi:hypothetical protein
VVPASYAVDNVVTVAATTRADELADYSNFSATKVMLAAPGSQILSTWNTSDSTYATESGISMATPCVAGIFALTKAAFPNDTYTQLIGRVKAASDPLAVLNGKCSSGGRVNLRKALGVPELKPVRLAVMPSSGSGGLRFTINGSANTSYMIEASTDLVNWASLFTWLSSSDGTLGPGFWQEGLLETALASAAALNAVLFFDDMGDQTSVGPARIGRQFEVIIPMGQEPVQLQVFELGR